MAYRVIMKIREKEKEEKEEEEEDICRIKVAGDVDGKR